MEILESIENGANIDEKDNMEKGENKNLEGAGDISSH